MVKSRKKAKEECNINYKCSNNGCTGMGYFLGFIGAATYYISTSVGFWPGVLGFLKALVWPAFLVFDLFKFLAA